MDGYKIAFLEDHNGVMCTFRRGAVNFSASWHGDAFMQTIHRYESSAIEPVPIPGMPQKLLAAFRKVYALHKSN
jgi:hypothetical protein